MSLTAKKKKLRFIDDDTRDPDEIEKDTRLKFAKPKPPPVTSLQKRMLQMAGQQAPPREEEVDSDKERDKDRDSSSSSDSEDEDDYDRRKRRVRYIVL